MEILKKFFLMKVLCYVYVYENAWGGSPPGFMMDSYRVKNSASNGIGIIFGTKR